MIALLLFGAAFVCRDAPAAETEVARCPELGLRLLRPGWRWSVLDRAAASSVFPNAVLGAIGPAGQSVLVLAHAPPGIDLEAFVRVQQSSVPGARPDVGPPVPVAYAGRRAVRLRVAYEDGGGWVDEEDIYFLHAGHLVQIQARVPRVPRPAWWPGEGPPAPTDLDAALAAFHEALSIQEPPAPDTLRGVRGADRRGVGWCLRNGVLEHAYARLRLTIGEAWDVVPAAAASRIDEDAELVVVHRDTGAVLALLHDADLGVGDETHRDGVLRELMKAHGADGQGPEHEVSFVDGPLSFATGSLGAPYPREIACAARRMGSGVLVLRTIVDHRHLEPAWEALRALLQTAQRLADDAHALLTADLASRHDPDERIDATACVRDGTWSGFAHGWTWTKPSSSWRLRTASLLGSSLVARDLATGVHGHLQWIPPPVRAPWMPEPTSADWHRSAVARAALDAPPQRAGQSLEVAGQAAFFTTWVVEFAPGGRMVIVLVTVPWQGGCLVLRIAGPLHGGEAVDDAMRAFVEGFRALAEDARGPRRTAHRIEDRRLGLVFSVPAAGWLLRDETPATLAPRGGLVHALGPQQDVVLAALFTNGNPALARDSVVAEIRRNLGAMFLSAVEMPSRPGRLAGLDATCHAWQLGKARADLWIASRGEVVYALCVTTRPDGGGLTIDEVEPALQWVR